MVLRKAFWASLAVIGSLSKNFFPHSPFYEDRFHEDKFWKIFLCPTVSLLAKGGKRGVFWLWLCCVTISCTAFNGFAGDEPVKGEEKEKSELAMLMGEIDKNYKVLEKLSTYFCFEEVEKERKIYSDASAGLVAFCKTATTKFARPDDDKYQEFHSAMLTASENIDIVFRDKDKVSVLEDVLWQVGLLRQTCADCHKHLDIKIGTGKNGKK